MSIQHAENSLQKDLVVSPRLLQGWSEHPDKAPAISAAAADFSLAAPRPATDCYILLRLSCPPGPPRRMQLSLHREALGCATIEGESLRAWRIPAAWVDRSDDLIFTIHMFDANGKPVSLRQARLRPDWPGPAAEPSNRELTRRGMMLRFESLGQNCEFGLVQRGAGAEPLGLLRFSSSTLTSLLAALDAGFAGFDDAANLRVRLGHTGSEFMVEDDRYGLFYHAWVKAGEMTPEQVLRRETRRIPLLLRKFKEDLAAGHKLFVFKGSLPPDEVYPLLPALRQYGPNRLLYVCPADAAHPPGTVEWAAPDFLVGYVDRFAPEENAHDLSLDSWLAVCRAADGLAWPDLGEATAPKPAGQIATPPVLRRAPQPVLSTRLGFRLQSGNFVDSGGAGQGFAALHQLETPPHWVRLLFANDRTTPLHVDGAAVAATSASDDDVTPINALGEADMALWQRVTFDAGGRDVDPLDAVGSDTWRIELPANAGPQRQPQRAASDWVPLPGLARNDQGAGALLLVRSFSSGLQRYSGAAGQPDPAIGHRHVSFWCPGNPTAPPWNAEWRPFTSLFPSHGLQYIGTVPGATVVGIGSHTLHAIHSDGGLSGFALRACAMVSRPNLPVSWFNETQTGGSSADYAVGGAWAIRTLRPQIVLIESWCEYDLHLGIDAALCFARAMALADMARRAGGVPVLITPAPVFADNQAGERWRQANLAQAREAGRLGVPVLDLDALWGTGAWPNAFRPEFDRGNHRHQNRAGDLLAAEALANLLAGILCT